MSDSFDRHHPAENHVYYPVGGHGITFVPRLMGVSVEDIPEPHTEASPSPIVTGLRHRLLQCRLMTPTTSSEPISNPPVESPSRLDFYPYLQPLPPLPLPETTALDTGSVHSATDSCASSPDHNDVLSPEASALVADLDLDSTPTISTESPPDSSPRSGRLTTPSLKASKSSSPTSKKTREDFEEKWGNNNTHILAYVQGDVQRALDEKWPAFIEMSEVLRRTDFDVYVEQWSALNETSEMQRRTDLDAYEAERPPRRRFVRPWKIPRGRVHHTQKKWMKRVVFRGTRWMRGCWRCKNTYFYSEGKRRCVIRRNGI